MNHETARQGIEQLFIGEGRDLPALRAHLEGCEPCRQVFDATARAFRALGGKPDEMTSEELLLFAPPLPAAPVTRLRWPAPVLSAVLAVAAALTLVVWLRPPPQSEFSPRGTTAPTAVRTAVRALCSREVDGKLSVTEACAAGDRLAFTATPGAHRFVGVALVEGADQVEVLISGAEGALTPGEDAVLPNATPWRAGLRVVVLTADEPITPELARRCAQGECPASLERRELPLGAPTP